MVQGYSFIINLRIKQGSEREHRILELAKEYGLDPGCKLVDRILDDRYDLMQKRASEAEEIAEMEKKLVDKKRRLITGE